MSDVSHMLHLATPHMPLLHACYQALRTLLSECDALWESGDCSSPEAAEVDGEAGVEAEELAALDDEWEHL